MNERITSKYADAWRLARPFREDARAPSKVCKLGRYKRIMQRLRLSDRFDEAKLREGGDAIIETDLFHDLSVLWLHFAS